MHCSLNAFSLKSDANSILKFDYRFSRIQIDGSNFELLNFVLIESAVHFDTKAVSKLQILPAVFINLLGKYLQNFAHTCKHTHPRTHTINCQLFREQLTGS